MYLSVAASQTGVAEVSMAESKRQEKREIWFFGGRADFGEDTRAFFILLDEY